MEWEQQNNERRQAEMQRYDSGGQFNYEPFSYPWCEVFTPLDVGLLQRVEEAAQTGRADEAKAMILENMARSATLLKQAASGESDAMEQLGMSGRATINPVTGEVAQIYALCVRMNPRGQCLMFETEAGKPAGGG